jgi:hypothetical protein
MMYTHRNTSLSSVFDGFKYESLWVESSSNMEIVSVFENLGFYLIMTVDHQNTLYQNFIFYDI